MQPWRTMTPKRAVVMISVVLVAVTGSGKAQGADGGGSVAEGEGDHPTLAQHADCERCRGVQGVQAAPAQK